MEEAKLQFNPKTILNYVTKDLIHELLTDGISIFYMFGAFIGWMECLLLHEFSIYWLFLKEKRLATNRHTHSNYINIDAQNIKS